MICAFSPRPKKPSKTLFGESLRDEQRKKGTNRKTGDHRVAGLLGIGFTKVGWAEWAGDTVTPSLFY